MSPPLSICSSATFKQKPMHGVLKAIQNSESQTQIPVVGESQVPGLVLEQGEELTVEGAAAFSLYTFMTLCLFVSLSISLCFCLPMTVSLFLFLPPFLF